MQSSAHFIKLVWSSRKPVASSCDEIQLERALREIRLLDPREERNLIHWFRRQVKAQLGIRRVATGAGEQLPLPLPESPPPAKTNVVVFDFVAEYNERCPGCGRSLTENSRWGARRHYTCKTPGCCNKGALFILLLGTGDE